MKKESKTDKKVDKDIKKLVKDQKAPSLAGRGAEQAGSLQRVEASRSSARRPWVRSAAESQLEEVAPHEVSRA